MVASFELPGVASDSTLRGGISITPVSPCCLPHAPRLLRIRMTAYSMFVHTQTFLASPDPDPALPMVVCWAEWSRRARLILEYDCIDVLLLGTAGNHVVFASCILDFNQYDARNNMYGPVAPNGRVLRSSKNDESAAPHLESTPWPSRTGPQDMEIRGTTLPYRRTNITVPRGSSHTKFLVEDETGPLVSRVPP